ncbi:MAG: DUF4215 domain-containing protein [Deltaproteobacteria bacterium]|nr:DUF4215 domain-containing protein [Deltaproteobacteria bacterium]
MPFKRSQVHLYLSTIFLLLTVAFSISSCADGPQGSHLQKLCEDLEGATGDVFFDCPVCGDGIVEGGEECDDQNNNPLDGCYRCKKIKERCGNGLVEIIFSEDMEHEYKEGCDDGNHINGDGCASYCQLEIEGCGNGVIEDDLGEECDDSNTKNNDGCSSDCKIESNCGNGITEKNLGEECDDANDNEYDSCTSQCTLVCGNGLLDLSNQEECDDGNHKNGDGCSSQCKNEGPFPQ